jgi:hypothetical protein
MSDTPETDNLARGNHVVPTEFAQDLERERNQWRRMYEEADWHTVEAEVLKRERDEARQLLKAATRALNCVHVEVGGWIKDLMDGGKR